MKTIGFIGAGNMASAIINSLDPEYKIEIFDVDVSKCNKFAEKGYIIANSESDLVRTADIVFLAIKPAHLCTVLDNIKGTVKNNNILISIVAGISTGFIRTRIGNENVSVVRVMPNTPALLGKGATAVAFDNLISHEDKETVENIFTSIGMCRVIDEEFMNEVISVNSSSPAYAFMFIKALIDGGVQQGLDKKVAKDLALATLCGSVAMVENSDLQIEDLITQVCSPNGTTLKAVEILNKEKFEDIVKNAMFACTKRAKELEGELSK